MDRQELIERAKELKIAEPSVIVKMKSKDLEQAISDKLKEDEKPDFQCVECGTRFKEEDIKHKGHCPKCYRTRIRKLK